jgi:hypothetical protein
MVISITTADREALLYTEVRRKIEATVPIEIAVET